MKTPLKLLSLLAVPVIAFSFSSMNDDEMLGRYKGLMQGNLQWSKVKNGTPDQSMNSDEPKIHTIKRNANGQYYIENSKGAAIILQNLTDVTDGITFTIPKQTVKGKGADSVFASELKGLILNRYQDN